MVWKKGERPVWTGNTDEQTEVMFWNQFRRVWGHLVKGMHGMSHCKCSDTQNYKVNAWNFSCSLFGSQVKFTLDLHLENNVVRNSDEPGRSGYLSSYVLDKMNHCHTALVGGRKNLSASLWKKGNFKEQKCVDAEIWVRQKKEVRVRIKLSRKNQDTSVHRKGKV